jgi:hypothetical protein
MSYANKADEKAWRERNKEHNAKRYKAYYEANKDTLRAKQKERQTAHRQNNPEHHGVAHIVKSYKVPKEIAKELYQKSGESCDSCGEIWDKEIHKRRFCVDHNHNTGKVRGILCMDCNTSLGKLKESTKKILALAAYNEKYNGR